MDESKKKRATLDKGHRNVLSEKFWELERPSLVKILRKNIPDKGNS